MAQDQGAPTRGPDLGRELQAGACGLRYQEVSDDRHHRGQPRRPG